MTKYQPDNQALMLAMLTGYKARLESLEFTTECLIEVLKILNPYKKELSNAN